MKSNLTINYALCDWFLKQNQPVKSLVKNGEYDYIDIVIKVARLIRSYVFDAVEKGELPLYYIKTKDCNYLEYVPEAYVIVDILQPVG
jgi:hypothetical protein